MNKIKSLLSSIKKKWFEVEHVPNTETKLHFKVKRSDGKYQPVEYDIIGNGEKDQKIIITKTSETEVFEVAKSPNVEVLETRAETIVIKQQIGIKASELNLINEIIQEENS